MPDYAAQCEAETGISVPAFTCDDPNSTLVPVTNAFDKNNAPLTFGPNSDFVDLYSKVRNGSGGRCDMPDRLNRECDPGSRFHVINRTPDAYVVAHCRKKGNAGNTWGDIAVIQHNTKNGATCFYQEGPAPGLLDAVAAPKSAGPNQWLTPAQTRGEGCADCHDDGPIIRFPYLAQIQGANKLPGAGDDAFNSKESPYYFVGPDFAAWTAFTVEIKGNTCNGCHRMGVNNQALSGTAIDFGIRATQQAPELGKNPHSAASPIWMTPGQVTFNPANAAAAQAIHDCAAHRLDIPLPALDSCRITPFTGKAASAWNGFELAPPGSAASGARIAALSRLPGTMEIFWVGANGSVQDAYWYDNAGWKRFELAPPGSAAPGGGIAALSRISNSMEVFWVGADGSVQDAFWYGGAPWKRFTLAPAGSAATTSTVAALSRLPDTMEVFWAAPNGSVQDAYWYDGGAPWKRFELSPPGTADTGGGLAAVSRIPTSMEVFWTQPDGAVRDAYWYDTPGAGWKGFDLAPAGSASAKGGFKAVSRRPETMELWWVGADGSVQDAYWYENTAWKRFTLAPAGAAAPGGGVAALSRIPASMETWWVGADAAVRDNYFYEK